MISRITALCLSLYTIFNLAHACALDVDDDNESSLRNLAAVEADHFEQTQANDKYRDTWNGRPRAHTTTAIQNVTLFDSTNLSGPRTIVIKDGRIADNGFFAVEDAYEIIDGTGHTLLPGFIDSHFHPDNISHLEAATRYGVTTGVIMACQAPQLCTSLQGHVGLSRIISASAPGAAVNSIYGRMLGLNASTALGQDSAVAWVDEQAASGAELIKLIAETPGLDQATLSAATAAAHVRNLVVACHATDYKSVQQALSADVDQVHHVPLDRALDVGAIARFNAISVPTLIMMRKTSEAIPALNFSASLASARALHESGITMLAGTDANAQSTAPGHSAFGEGIHDELELLVEAGLEPLQALRSATKLAADVWGLDDRGSVEPGMVADLVLVQGDPSRNISDTRRIRKVWVGGHAFEG
jgi:imidazolonepropionase-like amidohydrolase